MPNDLRLKGQAARRRSPYPLGQIPPGVITEVGKQIVHRVAVGMPNIEGNDFGSIFAKAIGGEHRNSPLGIADVTWEECAWSVKTVQASRPFTATSIRAISGRNSPTYSENVSELFADIQATGASVLNIWNARVDESLNYYNDLRILVMVRNFSTLHFSLFEIEGRRYVPDDYRWALNQNNNFLGYDIITGRHHFTWQPHGSQFTVIHHIPGSRRNFLINHTPSVITEEDILRAIGFDPSWVQPAT